MFSLISRHLHKVHNIYLNNFEFAPSISWKQKDLLQEEFKSLGFYISNHPLNEYKEIFNILNVVSYNQFYQGNTSEGLVAGTIMSIQEKKSSKGSPYAIIKLSDERGEFELFLFSEMLVANRNKLIESESFVMTLQKDKISNDGIKQRINVKKIVRVNELIEKPYSKVTIEFNENYNIEEIKKILSTYGETKVNLIFKNKNNKAHYLLENNRKFDINHFKALKAKKYVANITV